MGSDNLGTFVKNNKERLKADVVLISDTAMIANDVPSINTGLRGLSYVEVEVTGPNRDLHSGVYGGAVANPINARPIIRQPARQGPESDHPRFLRGGGKSLSKAERDALAEAPFNLDEYKKDLNVKDVRGETGYTSEERSSIRPTLDVNGIWGGYIGEGAKTVLPSKAFAKLSMRLVPDQKSDAITSFFKDHFEKIAPPGVTVVVRPHHGGEAAVTPIDSPAYLAASKAMEETFGKKPIPHTRRWVHSYRCLVRSGTRAKDRAVRFWLG